MEWLHGIEGIETDYEDSVPEMASARIAQWFNREEDYIMMT